MKETCEHQPLKERPQLTNDWTTLKTNVNKTNTSKKLSINDEGSFE